MMDLGSSAGTLIHPAFHVEKQNNIKLHHQFSKGIPMFTDSFLCACRYALQDMDKFSLKDSGRGDSEAGDSDCEMGRESPVDRLLLGEGFSDLMHLEMHHRLHPGTFFHVTVFFFFQLHSATGTCFFLFCITPSFSMTWHQSVASQSWHHLHQFNYHIYSVCENHTLYMFREKKK